MLRIWDNLLPAAGYSNPGAEFSSGSMIRCNGACTKFCNVYLFSLIRGCKQPIPVVGVPSFIPRSVNHWEEKVKPEPTKISGSCQKARLRTDPSLELLAKIPVFVGKKEIKLRLCQIAKFQAGINHKSVNIFWQDQFSSVLLSLLHQYGYNYNVVMPIYWWSYLLIPKQTNRAWPNIQCFRYLRIRPDPN